MKIYFIQILFCVLFQLNTIVINYSQNILSAYRSNYFDLSKEYLIQDNNLKNIPFRFGTELLWFSPSKVDPKSTIGILGFMDINLHDNISFLKFEYIKTINDDSENGQTTLFTLGLNYRIANFLKRNNVYFHGALAFGGNKTGFGGGIIVSLRYMHAFSKYFGIVSSIRYTLGGKSFIISGGVQLFTQ